MHEDKASEALISCGDTQPIRFVDPYGAVLEVDDRIWGIGTGGFASKCVADCLYPSSNISIQQLREAVAFVINRDAYSGGEVYHMDMI